MYYLHFIFCLDDMIFRISLAILGILPEVGAPLNIGTCARVAAPAAMLLAQLHRRL